MEFNISMNSYNQYSKLSIKFFSSIVVLGVLFILAFYKLNLTSIIEKKIIISYALFSFITYMLWQLSISYRWWYCINKINTSNEKCGFYSVVNIIFVGNLISISLLPSIIGQDAVKLINWKKISKNFTEVLQSIFVTRIAGLLGVAGFGMAFAPGIFWFNIVSIDRRCLDVNLINTNPLSYILTALVLLTFSMVILKKTGIKLNPLVNAIRLLDWKIITAGIISQMLFIISASCALLSIKDIDFLTSIIVTGFSALGRVLPLSIFGITIGEGIQSFLLLELNWNLAEITTGTGILLIFLYITAFIGFIMETAHHFFVR